MATTELIFNFQNAAIERIESELVSHRCLCLYFFGANTRGFVMKQIKWDQNYVDETVICFEKKITKRCIPNLFVTGSKPVRCRLPSKYAFNNALSTTLIDFAYFFFSRQYQVTLSTHRVRVPEAVHECFFLLFKMQSLNKLCFRSSNRRSSARIRQSHSHSSI